MNNEAWWTELIEKRKTEAIGLVKVKDIISKDLYPDNTHFIYELLQNAEDAKATEVSFELFSNKLIFKHNGKRLFSKTDIERITDINNYDTQEEKNEVFGTETIGKFGIGFKAVFGYTDTPQIHSGEFHFEIYDLVVPKQINSMEMSLDETIMVFPFNHTHQNKEKCKTSKIAFNDIKIWLETIKDNTLLFLTNIRKISYSINDVVNNIERDEIDDISIKIINTKNNTVTKWLRFKKYVPKKDNLYVSVAFQLVVDSNTQLEYIKPINGQVSIFFPAKKEVSNLKFHIHAPFVSTVARDSIMNNLSENNELLNLIPKLLLDVLKYIKRKKLLDYNFLTCMPNREDNLSDFYMPIQKSLIEYFNYQSFLITETGVHRSASECFLIKSRESQNVLTPMILKQFIELFEGVTYKNVYYLDREKIEYRCLSFIKILDVKIIDNSKLFEYLKILSMDVKDYLLQDIMQSEPDKWFKSLYGFLSRESIIPQFKKFILLDNDKLNLNQQNCYFSKIEMSHFLVVKESVYFRNSNAENFLKKMGVKEIGEKETIEIILKENYQNIFVETEKHIVHIRKFLTYYQRHKTDIEFFKNYNFIRVTEYDGYEKAEKIYIDSPFEKTGMRILFKDNQSLFSLNEVYHKLEKDRKKVFLEFLKRLGVKSQLSIQKKISSRVTISFHRGRKWIQIQNSERDNKNRQFTDYMFENSEKIFETQNIDVSLLIWETIKKLGKEQLRAYLKFKTNKDPKVDLIDDSTVLHQLKTKVWIPDKDGNFFKPQDIAKEQLYPRFYFSVGNVWLDAIELGKNIKRDEEEYKKTKQIVEEATSFSLSQLEKAQKFGITDDDIEKLIHKKETQKLRESLGKMGGDGEKTKFIQAKNNETIITDEEKFEEAVKKENRNNTSSATHASTKYKRQDSKSLDKVDKFLYKEYEGHCQICGDTFAYEDKNTYKTKSLNVGKLRDVNRKGNSLSLCFKHHAIFERNLRKYSFYDEIKEKNKLSLEFIKGIFEQYDWVGKDDINIKNDAFYMLDEKDEFMRDEVFFLGIKIFGEELFLKFTKAHILEFIEVWNEN